MNTSLDLQLRAQEVHEGRVLMIHECSEEPIRVRKVFKATDDDYVVIGTHEGQSVVVQTDRYGFDRDTKTRVVYLAEEPCKPDRPPLDWSSDNIRNLMFKNFPKWQINGVVFIEGIVVVVYTRLQGFQPEMKQYYRDGSPAYDSKNIHEIVQKEAQDATT